MSRNEDIKDLKQKITRIYTYVNEINESVHLDESRIWNLFPKASYLNIIDQLKEDKKELILIRGELIEDHLKFEVLLVYEVS